jgi:hypothetical protein
MGNGRCVDASANSGALPRDRRLTTARSGRRFAPPLMLNVERPLSSDVNVALGSLWKAIHDGHFPAGRGCRPIFFGAAIHQPRSTAARKQEFDHLDLSAWHFSG